MRDDPRTALYKADCVIAFLLFCVVPLAAIIGFIIGLCL